MSDLNYSKWKVNIIYVCLLFIYLVNKTQRILIKKQGLKRREKRTGIFYWLRRERKSITLLKGFEWHYSSIINAKCFVTNKLPVFIVQSLPYWINFYVYLCPISNYFFLIQSQIFSWLSWPPTELSGRKKIIAPSLLLTAFKYISYHSITLRVDLPRTSQER